MVIYYDFDDNADFEYDVDYIEEINFLANIIEKKQNISIDEAKNYVDDNLEELEEDYYSKLKEHFEKKARNEYADDCEYEKSEYAYYGLCPDDFN